MQKMNSVTSALGQILRKWHMRNLRASTINLCTVKKFSDFKRF